MTAVLIAITVFIAHALWHVLLLSPLLALVAWWRSGGGVTTQGDPPWEARLQLEAELLEAGIEPRRCGDVADLLTGEMAKGLGGDR